jgi:hypothetical protein
MNRSICSWYYCTVCTNTFRRTAYITWYIVINGNIIYMATDWNFFWLPGFQIENMQNFSNFTRKMKSIWLRGKKTDTQLTLILPGKIQIFTKKYWSKFQNRSHLYCNDNSTFKQQVSLNHLQTCMGTFLTINAEILGSGP